MIHPIPPGTRDVLPDEMRELRALESALLDVFVEAGYGQVSTPTLEYDEVLRHGDERGAGAAYRLLDEGGRLLALRSDMTIPIARLVATRCRHAEPPLRFCYLAGAFRAVRPQRGQQREFLQAGIELIGAGAPDGTAEVIEVLERALDSVGLSRARIGLGHAALYGDLLRSLGVPAQRVGALLETLARQDLVGLEAEVAELEGIGEGDRATLAGLPQLRGGGEVLDRALELGGEAVAEAISALRETYEALSERGAAERVILDLGLLRDLGYYTGAIVEVYDPALGHVLGGGGRYDELLGRYGAPMPAAGFALYVERVHVAIAEEERLNGGDS